MKILFLIIFSFVCLVGMADEPKPELKPIPITDEITKKVLTESYRAILDADKNFQIALLRARIKCKVDETWPINLETMTFMPPEPPKKEKP